MTEMAGYSFLAAERLVGEVGGIGSRGYEKFSAEVPLQRRGSAVVWNVSWKDTEYIRGRTTMLADIVTITCPVLGEVLCR